MKKTFSLSLRIISLIIFLFAFASIQYFIWSDLFIQEFDADVAENVIWAQAAIESGSIFNPDFYYNQLLPFGGSIIFIPVVHHFGVGLFALRLGLCIWSLLFAAVLTGFFLAFGWGFTNSLFSSGIILLFLSGTEKLREIFWAHIVHYNLSIFFLLLSFIFLSCAFSSKLSRRIAGIVFFLIFLMLGSTNDIAVVLFFSVTILLSIILERFLHGGLRHFLCKKNLIIFGMTGGAVVCGLILGRILCADASTAYVDQYSVFSPAGNWVNNLLKFPEHWFGMFMRVPKENIPFFSSVGIKLFIRVCVGLSVFAVSVRSVFVYKTLRSRLEKIFVCTHWIICCEIVFFFTFGVISSTNWRIIPMFFTSIVTVLIILRSEFASFSDRLPYVQLMDLGTFCFLLLYAGICSFTVFHQPINTDLWFGQGTLLKSLADHGLTYGYNLDYWFSNSITVLTDERIKVREVVLKDNKLAPSNHQANTHWYEDQPDVDRYFLICQEDEYWRHPEFSKGASEIFRATQYRTFIDGIAGYFIFVYDHNIF